jgi:hypothetical protein
MNFPLVYLDATTLSAVGTSTFRVFLGGHFAAPVRLNHPAQPLTDFVSRNFDLVVVRRPRPLLDGLDLGRDISRLIEDFGEFFFELCLFRVHAMLPEF